MTYIIALPCVDVKDRACVEECPVDCIYEGNRMLYIHPEECVDCGACEPVCPVEAIYYEDDLPEDQEEYFDINAQFFENLGSPGGAARLGPVDQDHPTVEQLPPQLNPVPRAKLLAEEPEVTYIIALPCVDVKDRACVEECPVDCIYEGNRMLYIHPEECVDCGACEPVCPVEAIYYEDDLPEDQEEYFDINAQFFENLGSPGGAARLGPVDQDHPTVEQLPPQGE